MAFQQRTVGSVFQINLGDNKFAYGQILDKGYVFFDYPFEKRIEDIDILMDCNTLFIVMVYKDVITSKRWEKIGKIPIRESLKILPMKFIQDSIDSSKFSLYNPNTGEITPCKKEDCIGLERAAVWEGSHVEDRIRDHYNGVPNIWTNQLAIKE